LSGNLSTKIAERVRKLAETKTAACGGKSSLLDYRCQIIFGIRIGGQHALCQIPKSLSRSAWRVKVSRDFKNDCVGARWFTRLVTQDNDERVRTSNSNTNAVLVLKPVTADIEPQPEKHFPSLSYPA
jgi:hypothetical protein